LITAARLEQLQRFHTESEIAMFIVHHERDGCRWALDLNAARY
jgi:hypothetical protein